MANLSTCSGINTISIAAPHFNPLWSSSISVRPSKKKVSGVFSAQFGIPSLKSVGKRYQRCGGQGAIECPGCKETEKKKQKICSERERWCCRRSFTRHSKGRRRESQARIPSPPSRRTASSASPNSSSPATISSPNTLPDPGNQGSQARGNVPCLRRAISIEEEYEAAGGEVLLDNEDNDGWLATHGRPKETKYDEDENLPSIDALDINKSQPISSISSYFGGNEEDVIPDMTEYVDPGASIDAMAEGGHQNLLQRKTDRLLPPTEQKHSGRNPRRMWRLKKYGKPQPAASPECAKKKKKGRRGSQVIYSSPHCIRPLPSPYSSSTACNGTPLNAD